MSRESLSISVSLSEDAVLLLKRTESYDAVQSRPPRGYLRAVSSATSDPFRSVRTVCAIRETDGKRLFHRNWRQRECAFFNTTSEKRGEYFCYRISE